MDETIFTLLVIFFVVGVISHGLLLSFLRKNHPEIWNGLGSPTLFINNSVKNNRLVLKFLWRKEYLQVDDTKLHRIASANHYFGIFYITFFIVSIILIFPWSKIF